MVQAGYWSAWVDPKRMLVPAVAGQSFSDYQDRTLVNPPCKRIQVDEAWSFCYAKQKNVATAKAAPEGAGDIWTWVGLDAETKLVASFYVGGRDSEAAMIFMDDLAKRLANRVHLTSDGHRPYLEAVEGAFGGDIDYAQLVRTYGAALEGQRRCSPAICTGARKHRIEGNPDPKHISTSFSERQNLNIRMGNRRNDPVDERLFQEGRKPCTYDGDLLHALKFRSDSLDAENHPERAAGVTPRLWEMSDMVQVLEDWERPSIRPAPWPDERA